MLGDRAQGRGALILARCEVSYPFLVVEEQSLIETTGTPQFSVSTATHEP
jgi:hypothetical protein